MPPPKKLSNKQILTRNKNRRRNDNSANIQPDIIWDSKSRTEYLTGFEKRKKKKSEKSIEKYQNELKELKRERLREKRRKLKEIVDEVSESIEKMDKINTHTINNDINSQKEEIIIEEKKEDGTSRKSTVTIEHM